MLRNKNDGKWIWLKSTFVNVDVLQSCTAAGWLRFQSISEAQSKQNSQFILGLHLHIQLPLKCPWNRKPLLSLKVTWESCFSSWCNFGTTKPNVNIIYWLITNHSTPWHTWCHSHNMHAIIIVELEKIICNTLGWLCPHNLLCIHCVLDLTLFWWSCLFLDALGVSMKASYRSNSHTKCK